MFTIYGTRFHVLDENPEYQLSAPRDAHPQTIWFNIVVPSIEETFSKAMAAGCKEIQPVTESEDFGVSNALFSDPFGYIWMLHQIHREVNFEERQSIFSEWNGEGKVSA